MIEVSKRRLPVDGRPRIVLAGEVQYFRVPQDTDPSFAKSC